MGSPLQSLLEGIVDYAGLFPPAKLGMPEAVSGYLRHKAAPERWIVNRFLCPAGRLEELRHRLGEGGFPVGVIGTGGADLDGFETALETDANAMSAFEDAVGDRAPIEAYEVRMPATDQLNRVLSDLEAFSKADVFLETPWDESQRDVLAAIAETGWLGAKGRTGGLAASAFPSSAQLAAFLKDCQDLDIDFKLTAGLHHPIRRHDPNIGATMHGFMNILCALALNEEHELSRGEMAEILEGGSELVAGGGFAWNGAGVSFSEAQVVRGLFAGFGSCSVDEPIEGLQELSLLQEAQA